MTARRIGGNRRTKTKGNQMNTQRHDNSNGSDTKQQAERHEPRWQQDDNNNNAAQLGGAGAQPNCKDAREERETTHNNNRTTSNNDGGIMPRQDTDSDDRQ